MPWEIIADFKRSKELTPESAKWGSLASAITAKLIELEPKLRFRIRNLPQEGRPKNVFPGLGAQDVAAPLHGRLEAPDAKTYWIRQYLCSTCGTKENPKWVPQMYLALHGGHELTKSEPTAKGKERVWDPGFRLFIGSPARLKGLEGVMYSVALTSAPAASADLNGYDVVLVIPSGTGTDIDVAKLKKAVGAEEAAVLPANPTGAVLELISWMKKIDSKAIEPDKEETDISKIPDSKAIEAIQARISAAQGYLASKIPKSKGKEPDKAVEISKVAVVETASTTPEAPR